MWSRDIGVPRIDDGELRYTVMEIVPMGPPISQWMLRQKVVQPPTSAILGNGIRGLPFGVGDISIYDRY